MLRTCEFMVFNDSSGGYVRGLFHKFITKEVEVIKNNKKFTEIQVEAIVENEEGVISMVDTHEALFHFVDTEKYIVLDNGANDFDLFDEVG